MTIIAHFLRNITKTNENKKLIKGNYRQERCPHSSDILQLDASVRRQNFALPSNLSRPLSRRKLFAETVPVARIYRRVNHSGYEELTLSRRTVILTPLTTRVGNAFLSFQFFLNFDYISTSPSFGFCKTIISTADVQKMKMISQEPNERGCYVITRYVRYMPFIFTYLLINFI